MVKRRAKRDRRMPIMRVHAAGMDIGAEEVFVAVPDDHDPQPVRRFSTFTSDLYALADWLQQCGITTVAMESTGVYWIPVFQILEGRGFPVTGFAPLRAAFWSTLAQWPDHLGRRFLVREG